MYKMQKKRFVIFLSVVHLSKNVIQNLGNVPINVIQIESRIQMVFLQPVSEVARLTAR